MSPLHPGAERYVDRVNAGPAVWEITIEEARRGTDAETLEVWGPVDEVARVEDLGAGGVPIRVYRPEATEPLPLVVYFHGGGWAVGSIESHDPLCRALATRTPCVVVSVEYRRAPESPFPAAVEDAWAATVWAAEHAAELGGDADRLVVAGDSAGGNLAAVVALRARDRTLPVALQVLIYPVTDHDLDSPGYASLGTGLNLTRAKMEWYWGTYAAGADPAQPEASPLRARDLTGVAPALVQTAEYDPLYHEGEEYARMLGAAGVPVVTTRYDGQIHGFVRLPAYCGDAAREALEEIAAAVRALPTPAALRSPRSRSASPY